MALKKTYNVQNHRISNRYDLFKAFVIISLLILVICAIIGLTVYIMRNSPSKSAETHGQANFHDAGNNGNSLIKKNTTKFTSTTFDTSSSTVSPKDVRDRFITVKTDNAVDLSKSDHSTAGSASVYSLSKVASAVSSDETKKINPSPERSTTTTTEKYGRPKTRDDTLLTAGNRVTAELALTNASPSSTMSSDDTTTDFSSTTIVDTTVTPDSEFSTGGSTDVYSTMSSDEVPTGFSSTTSVDTTVTPDSTFSTDVLSTMTSDNEAISFPSTTGFDTTVITDSEYSTDFYSTLSSYEVPTGFSNTTSVDTTVTPDSTFSTEVLSTMTSDNGATSFPSITGFDFAVITDSEYSTDVYSTLSSDDVPTGFSSTTSVDITVTSDSKFSIAGSTDIYSSMSSDDVPTGFSSTTSFDTAVITDSQLSTDISSTLSLDEMPTRSSSTTSVDTVVTPDSTFSTSGSTDVYPTMTSENAATGFSSTTSVTADSEFSTDLYSSETKTTRTERSPRTCTTNLCKQSTSRMLAFVNHTAEPCEDFYSYACGGFDINHFKEFTVNDDILESLPDMSTLDLTVPYQKLYHDFFISCTKFEIDNGQKEASKLLRDLLNKKNLTDLIAAIILSHPHKKLSRLLPLFDVVMEVGPAKTLIPTVSLPKLKSPLSEDDDRDLYERSCLSLAEMETNNNKKNTTKIQETYNMCIQDHKKYFVNLNHSIFLFEIFEHSPISTKTLRFIEHNIIDRFGFNSDNEFKNADYTPFDLKSLKDTCTEINWNELFERLFGKEIAGNINTVRLTHLTQLSKIFDFYKSHSFEEIRASMVSMMAHDMYLDFMKPLPSNRYKYCSNVATKLMPDIASKLYLEKFSSSDILHETETKLNLMFEQLKRKFNATLFENTPQNLYISEDIRKNVSIKLFELNVVSNPHNGFINFGENFDRLYSEVVITTNDYILNVFALKQVVRRRMYETHGKSALSSEIIWNYLAWPISKSPVRIAETTAIVIPTSLIAKFTKETLKVEEFSALGFLVVQEISHLVYTDKKSTLFVNNVEDIKTIIDNQSKPIISGKPNIFGVQLNQKVMTESQHFRFIDDFALRVTFDAYDGVQSLDKVMPWTGYSSSQIFYLLTSQQFCNARKSTVEVAIDLTRGENLPNYFRVNSMMSNSKKLLETFECPNRS